ncbi:MAG: phosphate/phosphite/phosphonate ABC transporter substrate-binding protein [Spirulina sp.]
MDYFSQFSTLKERYPKTKTFILLGLTIALLNVGCVTNSQPDANESASNDLSSSVEPQKNAEQKFSSLNIAMSPSQSSDEQKQQRELLADYLEEKLGLPVNIQISQDYENAIDLIAEGKVQMAYLGPFSYVRAKQRNPQLEPLVAYIDKRTGRPWYTSTIVANTQSGIKTVEDLKGKRFGFVNQSSTSGYLVPLAHLVSNNIAPEQDFREVQYTGSHNKNAEALASGKIDAVGINKPTYLKAQKSGQLPPDKYQPIWESDPIPNAPIVISRELPADVRSNLQKALINAPPDMAALSGAKSDGYTLVRDGDYDPIRELQNLLALDTPE